MKSVLLYYKNGIVKKYGDGLIMTEAIIYVCKIALINFEKKHRNVTTQPELIQATV